MTAVEAGRMLMEAGANATSVEAMVEKVALGLGAERVDLRIGYASLAVTIVAGQSSMTRMRRVGHLGVNHRLDQAVWDVANRVARRELAADETRTELARLAKETPRHGRWVTAAAVGLACASFGRLLGVDWLGSVPVFLASTIGQAIRSHLLARHVNAFLCTTLVSVVSSVFAGVGARSMGSRTFAVAMVASILLLVPGVPAVNGQTDILEGRPTLGSARLASVAMVLVFIAVGLWVGQSALELMGKP